MINLFGKYIVFHKESGETIKRFYNIERAKDLCSKLNTDAYLSEISDRYDIKVKYND